MLSLTGVVALSFIVVLVSALVRSFTGFGFALLAVPGFSLFLEPQDAVVVVTLAQVAFGLLDLVTLGPVANGPALRWMVPGAIIGTPIGIAALTNLCPSSEHLAQVAA